MATASIILNRETKQIVSIEGGAGILCSEPLLEQARTFQPSEARIATHPIPPVTIQLVPEDAGENVRIRLETNPPLAEIIETVECAKYAMSALEQGIGLVNVSQGKNDLVFGTPSFRRIWTESLDTFRPEGWRVIESEHVESCTDRNEYKAVLAERTDDDIPEPKKGASVMLNQFLERMFDARFYVDREFRITSKDVSIPRLRAMLGCEESLEGRAIESMMPLEIDRIRFREKFIPKITAFDINTDLRDLKCLTFRTRFLLADKMLAEVKLFVTPTFVDQVEPFNEETLKQHVPQGNEFPWIVVKLAAAQNPSKYLVGLQLTGSAADVPFSREELGELSSMGSEVSGPETRRRSGPPRISLEKVPEHSESELSSDPVVGESVMAPMMWSKQQATAVSVERCLSRDIVYSMSLLDAETDDTQDWVLPSYELSDMEVLKDELLRSLPSVLQYHFVTAVQRHDFFRCCEVLSHACNGSLNPLDSAFVANMNIDNMHCAIRFLIGFATKPAGPAAFKALQSMSEVIPKLPDMIGQQAGQVAQLQHTAAWLAVAIQHPKLVHIHQLRTNFSEALRLRESSGIIRSQRLPSLYFICLLWACLMRRIDRKGEAVPVLENLSEDMQNYGKRHPMSSAVCKMIGICSHNLAVTALENNDIITAFNWTYKVQAVIAQKRVQLPPKCQRLVAWAEATQTKVQLNAHPIAPKGG
jgi:hypothetical protein